MKQTAFLKCPWQRIEFYRLETIITEKVPTVASFTHVRVGVDQSTTHYSPNCKGHQSQRCHWSVTLAHQDFIFCQISISSKRFVPYFTHHRSVTCLSLISVTALYCHPLYTAASKEYLEINILKIICYFVWNFHLNWLIFLGVMQENEGCVFSEYTVFYLTCNTQHKGKPECNIVPIVGLDILYHTQQQTILIVTQRNNKVLPQLLCVN